MKESYHPQKRLATVLFKTLYRQEIDTRNFADLNCLRFDATNHVITYKSGGDDFVYNVLENSLKKKDEAK